MAPYHLGGGKFAAGARKQVWLDLCRQARDKDMRPSFVTGSDGDDIQLTDEYENALFLSKHQALKKFDDLKKGFEELLLRLGTPSMAA
jgi:hypothetical protein